MSLIRYPQEEQRFWELVDRRGECWLWTATKTKSGYGYFRGFRAHRYAWQIANDQLIPDGMYACHHCDNPPCVRPDHIYIGTSAQNARDRVARGHQGGGRKRPERYRHGTT